MQLPENLRERLVGEFRFATEKMALEDDPHRKLYFYSALFGEAGRILNLYWDPELALIHGITQQTFNQINARQELITSGRDRIIPVDDKLLVALTHAAVELTEYIDSGSDEKGKLCGILERFTTLAFLTTGNGYYLLQRGSITL